MAAGNFTTLAELLSFMRLSTRSGTTSALTGLSGTITYATGLPTSDVYVAVTPDDDIKLHIGRVSNASFDVTGSVELAGMTINWHAWT